VGSLRGALAPLSISSPSPLKERGTQVEDSSRDGVDTKERDCFVLPMNPSQREGRNDKKGGG